MYVTRHVIDTANTKYKQFSDEQILRHGSDNAHADYLWQEDTRGEMLDLSGYQIQFANFSDERRAKISMIVPKGYISNKFQLESFIISEGKKYALTLFVKKPQLRHVLEKGHGYPAMNVPSVLLGKSVEWKHPRDGVLARALFVHKIRLKHCKNK